MRACLKALAVVLGVFTWTSCSHEPPTGFIRLENGRFVEQGAPFFPVALNYIADLQWNDTACWAASCRNYERADRYRFSSRDSSLKQIEGEFTLIRRMGFNTVRIVGIASDLVFPPDGSDLHLKGRFGDGDDSLFTFAGVHEQRYLQAIDELLQVAERTDLKVILLVRLVPGKQPYEQRLKRLAERFRDRPVLLAYDLFNEPLYFDLPHHRPKEDVYTIVQRWRQLVRKHAPHQLVTIGLVGVPEVFAWDPNILDVDFISFHPYEYEPDQVRNEIHWYGEQVHKPWIIGETAIPADNDSVPYTDQLAFARKTLAQTVACGGIGYSWWQFKDVRWGKFHADHMGVMDRHGWTETGRGLPPVQGTIKPVASAFMAFDPDSVQGSCMKPDNYYNFSSLSSAKLTGRIVDQDRKPIAGGVVLGWNANWSKAYYTISRADGSFALYGDFRFHHWMVSATRYTMVRGECAPNAFLTGLDSVPAYALGEQRLEVLRFAE